MNELTIFALGAGIVALWGQIRGFLTSLMGYVVTTAVARGECATAMRLFLSQRANWSKWGQRRTYITMMQESKTSGRWEHFAGEFIGECSAVYWLGWRPLFVNGESDKGSANDGNDIRVSCLRWMFDLDKLIVDAMDEWKNYRNRPSGRFRITQVRGQRPEQGRGAYPTSRTGPGGSGFSANIFDLRPVGWNRDALLPSKGDAGSVAELALQSDALSLVARLEMWRRSEQWYLDHHVPWKLGFCLQGEPGTGKTALIRAIGRLLDLPVFVFDLATLDNQTFAYEWEKAVCESPCLCAFEDVDAVFEGRKNIAHSGNLTTSPLDFSAFLNAIDGLQVNGGVVVAVTTNHLEKIDSALLRPGRIDITVGMPALTLEGRKRIAARILREWPSEQKLAISTAGNLSGAEFQDLCTKRAQELFWKESVDAAA